MKKCGLPAGKAEKRHGSFDRADFILAALFLWMIFFLAALAVSEIAFKIASFLPVFFARRKEASSLETIRLFTFSFLFEPLRALFAVFVIGI